MRIEGGVFEDQEFEEQYQDQALEQGKYSLWFPCYPATLVTFIHTHVSNLLYPKDMPRNTRSIFLVTYGRFCIIEG
jgi:hypothetical protein